MPDSSAGTDTATRAATAGAVRLQGDVRESVATGQRQREMVDRSPALMWLLDMQGEIEYASPSWEAFTGRPVEDFMGEGWLTVLHPDDFQSTRETFWRARERDEAILMRHRLRRFDGEWRWVSVNAVPRLSPDARTIGYIGTSIDVTELVRAEEDARAMASLFRQLSDTAPLGIFLTDSFGDVRYTNASWTELTGLTAEESLGKGWMGAIHPDDVALVVQARNDAAAPPVAFAVNARILRRDGGERHVQLRSAPIEHEAIKQAEWVGAVVDLTETVQAQNELEQSERRYQRALSALDEGIYQAEFPSRHVIVSERFCDILGEDVATFRPTIDSLLAVLVREDNERLRSQLDDFLLSGESFELNVRFFDRAGNRRWGRLSGLLERFPDGTPHRLTGGLRDVTSRRDLELRVRQKEKMESLGTLAGGIAHDFNNILGVILGNAELGLSADDVPEALHENLDDIRAAALRARDLVRQILTFSRQSDLAVGVVDLSLLLQEAERFLRASFPATVELVVHRPDGPARVQGDATQLQQLVLNLAANAEHAMRSLGAGRLEISLRAASDDDAPPNGSVRDGDYWILIVRDTGRGFSREVGARLFEPFFTTKPAGEGTGLGLSVVHGIVSSHRGTITAQSAPGEGSEFRVWLPVYDGGIVSIHVASPLGSRPSTDARILIVEDEDAVAEAATRMLARYGYRSDRVSDGALALDVLREQHDRYGLVLTDYTMPRMTGLEVAYEVERSGWSLPFILMSGRRSVIPEGVSFPANIVATLSKPFGITELRSAIEAALTSRAQA